MRSVTLARWCSQKVSLRSSRWISWAQGKRGFSNSTQEGASYTWKEINHHTTRSPCYCIPEWIIWFGPTCSSYSTLMQWLARRPDVLIWLTVWWTCVKAWHLGVAWPALLVTEVFPSSLSDAPGSEPVLRPGFVPLICFLFKQAAVCDPLTGLMWLTWGGQACSLVPFCRMSLSYVIFSSHSVT